MNTDIMQLINIDPNELKRNDWNPNVVNPTNEVKLKKSLETLGQFKPIIVRQLEDDSYEILGGEHRNDAAIELGWDTVPVLNLGKMSEEQAKKISMADNARFGEDDFDSLSDLVKSLDDANDLSEILPTSFEEIDYLLNHNATDIGDLDIDPDDDLGTLDMSGDTTPTKTHQIIRFKVSIDDAQTISEKISNIRVQQGFVESDDLTNAGDALMFLLSEIEEAEQE